MTHSQLGGLQGFEQADPHAFLGQPTEAFAHGIGETEAFGQVRPRTAGAHYPDHRIYKRAVVFGRYPAVRWLTRQKRDGDFPLAVRYFVTTHVSE